MRIQIHNIGPIRDAAVTIHPLTVLIGPNGSGKTTVSTIAYAAAQANLKARREAGWSFLRRTVRLGDIDEARSFADRLIENWEDEFRQEFQRELQRCFGPDLGRLAREGRAGKGAAPRVLVSNLSGSRAWQLVFRLQKDGLVLERSSTHYRPPRAPVLESDANGSKAERPRSSVALQYERQVRRVLQVGMPADAVYLPAARSGLMQMHTTLTGLMLNAIAAGFLENATTGRAPGTAIDFLQFMGGLDPEEEGLLDEEVAGYFEDTVLHGEVRLEIEHGSRFVRFIPEGLEGAIDIEFAATSAAELAPLILYLRHNAGQGDCIFIDEPEAHFHPESQVVLAEGLLGVATVLSGVVIATHSEFLVSGISNALLAAGADEDELPRPRVQVYEFYCRQDDASRGFEVRGYQVDPDEGFDVGQFSMVAEEAAEQGIELYNALHTRVPD